MKFFTVVISLTFFIQSSGIGQAFNLLHTEQVVSSSTEHCHDDHSESNTSTSDNCDDCFHIHTCCHAKLVNPSDTYEWTPNFNSQFYQDFQKLFLIQPFLEGPFQPPKKA